MYGYEDSGGRLQVFQRVWKGCAAHLRLIMFLPSCMLDSCSVGPPPPVLLTVRQQRSILSRKGRSNDKSRTIPFRPPDKLQSKYPPNVVRNQKYNVFTFLPLVFYEQFKFFFNMYFLLVALSQFIPALKIGGSGML